MLQSGGMRVLGAMSGLAFDGVDAAVIETDGEKLYSIGESGYRPYTEGERSVLRAALGLDDDLTEFYARFKRDPLLGPAIRRKPWLRARRCPGGGSSPPVPGAAPSAPEPGPGCGCGGR